MDKTNIEKYIGAWIDNSHGVYTQDAISEKMRQIALEFGVPKNKLPTMAELESFGRFFYEYFDELQRDLEELLNEYCTTDLTCWAWHDNAFGLWYTSDIYDEEIA
tara:strand:+ start:2026 stop:2340 length:315 start_codon:yes stop_codon:yes gene_type:complete